MKKVRIQNDGKPAFFTKVTDAETGEDIPHLVRVDLTIDVKDDPPKAVLTTIFPVVDVIADADIKHVCPCCGRPPDPEPTSRLQQMLIDAVKAWGNEQTKAQY